MVLALLRPTKNTTNATKTTAPDHGTTVTTHYQKYY